MEKSMNSLELTDLRTLPEREDEYALVAGSRILTVALGNRRFPMPDYFPAGYVATGDERWLPVEEEAPGYDPKQHWKAVPPILRIEADRVVRVFGIIPKSLEAI